jgi:hypothetical protein
MADDLDNLALPYDYGKGEAPGSVSTAPAKPASPVQSAPSVPDTSHPDLDSLSLPYKPGEQPNGATPPNATPPGPSWTHAIWNSITGEDQPPIVLQPRSLSQVGTDVANYGRVAGNQVFVPGSLDVGLAALHGTDVAAENAKTKQAESELSPAAAAIARFQGQRLSANRILNEAGVPYANNPIAQGVVTGGGGTFLHGGSWSDILANAAADIGLSAAGEAAGTAAPAAAKKVFDQSKQAVSGASSATLEDLHDLWKRGGDVAGQAEEYAKSATGATKAAYQKIAAAASQSTAAGPLQRLGAATLGKLSGVGALTSAYVADPAFQAYNQFSKGLDVSHAIHQAYEPVAGVVKSVIDPQAWRNAMQSFAVSQGPTGSDTLNAVRNFSPTSWAKAIWPGS